MYLASTLGAGSVIAAILAIGILIILHEAGHYWAAVRSGMRVRRFSVGFGPSIAKIERGGTEFQIAAIPFGGFVQIDGMSPHDGSDPSAPDSYLNRPVHLRFATIFAGPFANYLVGFVLLFAYYAFFATEELAPVRVLRVAEASAAAKAGLAADDLIVGTSSGAFDRAAELIAAIQAAGGRPLALRVRRGEVEETRVVVPEPVGGAFRIGIELQATGHRGNALGVGAGLGAAWDRVWRTSGLVLEAVSGLFSAGGCDRVAGPIGMVKSLSASVRASVAQALAFVGDISIMLGLGNLLPIPSLDGSRLMFLTAGVIRRKPVDARVESIIHAAGFILLLVLLFVVSIGDVAR